MRDGWIGFHQRRVHYLYKEGSGPSVVFLPGGVLDAASLTWKKVVAGLPEGYRVLVIDLPGYGGSDPPDRPPPTTRSYASVVRRLLIRLEIRAPVLVAASMGAAVALELIPVGRDVPTPWHRFSGLVLTGAYGLQGRLPAHVVIYALSRLRRLAGPLRRSLRHRAVMREALRLVIHDPDAVDDELVADALREARRDGALEAYFEWLYWEVQPSCVMSNYREDLFRMHVPAAIIHGEHDCVIPPKAARDAARRFPDAELHLLDAGHMVPRERPQDVSRIVNAFLAKVAPL